MRILVTGGTGFVGSHGAAALHRAGHDVRVLARSPEKVPLAFAPLGIDPEHIEVAPGDMTDEESVGRAVDGCDAALHAAAEVGVAGGSGPAGDANVRGVRTVVGRALDAGLDPVVYTSTVAVHLPSDDPFITVDSPLAEPLSVYGRAKRDAEVFVRERQQAGAPVTTLVLGGVYGPRSPNLDNSFSGLIAALGTLMVAAPGGSSVVDVRDLADVIVRTMEPGRGPRRYVTGGHFLTWEGWAATLSRAVGREIPRHVMTAEQLIEMGRQFDTMRREGKADFPLSEEAAVIMTEGIPTDDSAAIAELDASWRPTVDTFRDAVAWLIAEGRLPAEPGLGRSS